MFDIGWSELLLIGVVALIVIGPEDLPKLFHTLGRLTARARSMAREFSMAMEDAAKSSGLDDAAKTLKDVKSVTSKRALGLDALERATERFEKWDPMSGDARQGAKPDPAAPTPPAAVTPAASATVPTAFPTPAQAAAPASVPASDSTDGKRRLHAVRRSDPAAGHDKKVH